MDAILAGIRLCFQDRDEFTHETPLIFELLGNKDLDRSIGLSQDFEQWLESLNQVFVGWIEQGQSQGQIAPDLSAPVFARMLVSTLDGMGTYYYMFHFQPEFFAAQVKVLEDMVQSYIKS